MPNNTIKQLIQQFAKLPNINLRQAKRITAYILEEFASEMSDVKNFVNNLEKIKCTISICEECNNPIFEDENCINCYTFHRKQFDTICVVENLYELWRMENLHSTNFTFHILGGIISATNGTTPDMLNIANLIKRIEENQISEVIIALNKSYNAVITTNYLAEVLRKKFISLKISTLAGGLPSGADLDFIDDYTLETAFRSRILC